jgi:integrase/recombinase XerD
MGYRQMTNPGVPHDTTMQTFIEDMELRNFSARTQRCYVHYVAEFALYYDRSPRISTSMPCASISFICLHERGLSAPSVNCFVSAVRFLYVNTLGMRWKSEDFVRARVEYKLPVVPGLSEVRALFENIPGIKNRMALMLCYGAPGCGSPKR